MDSLQRQKLADFVRRQVKEKRLSYREVARRSNGRISFSTVGGIIAEKYGEMTTGKLIALADGLGVAFDEVFAAAYGRNGIPAEQHLAIEEALVMSLPFQFQKLSAKDREALRPTFEMLAREMAERIRRTETAETEEVK